MFEDALFQLLNAVMKLCGLTDIALAGGCAMNSVENGKVRRVAPFRRVYVQAAAGDAGGAIGAALTVWHRLGGGRGSAMDHADWGPQFGRDAIEAGLSPHPTRLGEAGWATEGATGAEGLWRRVAPP